MISIVYCTREHKPEHIEHLKKACGNPKVEIIEYINNGEGLTKYYNKGLAETNNDIVLFCHDDILIETKQIAKKISKLFDNNPEYGIIGLAGTKYMSETGRWWDDRKKMYGRVKHTHEGKSWLSAYSGDLGNDLEEVVIVDGLFFAVHKNRIKKDFDLNVSGFHFYDVDFCFRNHLANVKVGVTTSILVNHMSIGATNDEWEENRKIFTEKFKDKLPIKIKKVFRKNEKIKVLIGCLSFANLTGSELYVYELAKELVKQGCDVSICSQLGEPLARKAHSLGVKLYNIAEPPGYKRGDGQWGLNTPQGQIASEPGKLYKVADINFDVIHLNHKPITEFLLQCYPGTETVCSIHSEVLDLEIPVVNDQIKKYIAIRPEIKEFITKQHDIPEDIVDVVYNPIDYTKFNDDVKKTNTSNQLNGNKKIIFVGTIDYLRKKPLLDLIKTTRETGDELWIVGKENGVTIDELKAGASGDNSHITYYEPTPNVHKLVKQCDETAGILLGRTTIEGWLCGKGGWIYDIDKQGNILGKNFHPVPSDVNKFRSDSVAKEIIEIYKNVIE